MIKVLMVDDMPMVLCKLKNATDRVEYGFEICGEDVLPDIKMPKVDENEILERPADKNPDVSIVIITEKMNKYQELQEGIEEILKEKKDQQLRRCIYSKRECFPDKISDYFLVAVIRSEVYDSLSGAEELSKWEQTVVSILSDLCSFEGNTKMFRDYDGNMVCILNFETAADMEAYDGQEFIELIRLVREQKGLGICVGVSDNLYSVPEINKGYYQAVNYVSEMKSLRTASFIDFRKRKHTESKEFYSWSTIEEINNALEILDKDRVVEIISDELKRISIEGEKKAGDMVYMGLLSILFSYIVKLGKNIDEVLQSGISPYNELCERNTPSLKTEFVIECFVKTINYQLANTSVKGNLLANRAKEYIDEHFSDSGLSVNDVSRALLLNQTYLRRMFKDCFHMTLSDYMTKCRLEKAKSMLSNGNYKLSAIAEMVGYNDVSYFSKCFKKYFGYTPGSFMK